MDYQLPMFQYGSCCSCGKMKTNVRNFVALNLRAPQPGTGWGCMVCHKPMNGALAVLCDECANAGGEVRWVVCGPIWAGRRLPIEQVNGKFEHNPLYHPEMMKPVGRLN